MVPAPKCPAPKCPAPNVPDPNYTAIKQSTRDTYVYEEYNTIITLYILQKRVIRIINGESFLAHTNVLFHKCNILKLRELSNMCNVHIHFCLQELRSSCA